MFFWKTLILFGFKYFKKMEKNNFKTWKLKTWPARTLYIPLRVVEETFVRENCSPWLKAIPIQYPTVLSCFIVFNKSANHLNNPTIYIFIYQPQLSNCDLLKHPYSFDFFLYGFSKNGRTLLFKDVDRRTPTSLQNALCANNWQKKLFSLRSNNHNLML